MIWITKISGYHIFQKIPFCFCIGNSQITRGRCCIRFMSLKTPAGSFSIITMPIMFIRPSIIKVRTRRSIIKISEVFRLNFNYGSQPRTILLVICWSSIHKSSCIVAAIIVRLIRSPFYISWRKGVKRQWKWDLWSQIGSVNKSGRQISFF